MRRTTTIAVLLSWCPLALAAEVPSQLVDSLPRDAAVAEWTELKTSAGTAFRSDAAVYVVLDGDTKGPLEIPRLDNPIRRVRWIGETERMLSFKPLPATWEIGLAPPPTAGPRIVVVETIGRPAVPNAVDPWVARPDEMGRVQLPAHRAITHGEKLRYEPQPHKNTVGFWANADDWAEWRVDVPQPGKYVVRVQQGCGAGQGGSRVAVSVGESAATFDVVDTGHFQNFRWRRVGEIEFTKGGSQRVELRCLAKAKNAVMDCRAIELVPMALDERRPVGTKPRRPNVLVFLADDLGTLDARCYGSRDLVTPTIDGLAYEGVRFTQAYAHTVCCPARAALLTGRHPQRGGVNEWTQPRLGSPLGINLHTDEATLAEVFKAAGYRTALFGKWHLGASPDHGPTRQGFDEFLGLRGGFIDNFNHHFLHGRGFHDLYRGIEPLHRPGEYFPDMMTAEAERFLDEHVAGGTDEPFFLYLPFNLPHYPEQSDPKWDLPYADLPMPRRSYARAVSTVDDRMARVLARIDEYGWRDDTIVLFTSDNGHSAETNEIRFEDHSSGLPLGHRYGANGGGGNTGRWKGSKATFYEGGLRIPAILRAPGRLDERNAVRDQVVLMQDWFPTLLDLTGVEPPAGVRLDGRSVRGIIERDVPTEHDVLHWQWITRWAVREGDWKLIQHGKKLELVNLSDDPPESVDHAADEPDVVDRLTRLHAAWAAEVAPRGE